MSISIRYMYIKTSNHVYNACPQVYPLLSTNVGESPFHGLIVAHFRINQIYIKTDEIKMKPYLHQNHSIGYVSLFVDFFHLQKQPNSSQCHMLYDNLFYLSNNGIWNSVFHVFMKIQLSVFKDTAWGKLQEAIDCSDNIKMPKSTTGCGIKSFMPVKNMSLEKLGDT